jgi:hypothetical protein
MKRRSQRWNDLQAMISLDHFSAQMFDIAPQTEYELYIKKFGRSQSAQVAVQCGEDNLTIDCQTEPIEQIDAQVQFPDDLGFAGTASGHGLCTTFFFFFFFFFFFLSIVTMSSDTTLPMINTIPSPPPNPQAGKRVAT